MEVSIENKRLKVIIIHIGEYHFLYRLKWIIWGNKYKIYSSKCNSKIHILMRDYPVNLMISINLLKVQCMEVALVREVILIHPEITNKLLIEQKVWRSYWKVYLVVATPGRSPHTIYQRLSMQWHHQLVEAPLPGNHQL